jgi:MarR family transcriptional regulator, temperature-dependent positive regulator of motility
MPDHVNSCLDAASVSEVLHRAAARIDASLDQGLATAGLTSRQYLLLKCVAANDGITQIGLTELSGIDRSTMTDMVGRLVSRGLLSREKKSTDARAYAVRITDSGRRHLDIGLPIAAKIDADVIATVAPEHRELFLSILLKIAMRPD